MPRRSRGRRVLLLLASALPLLATEDDHHHQQEQNLVVQQEEHRPQHHLLGRDADNERLAQPRERQPRGHDHVAERGTHVREQPRFQECVGERELSGGTGSGDDPDPPSLGGRNSCVRVHDSSRGASSSPIPPARPSTEEEDVNEPLIVGRRRDCQTASALDGPQEDDETEADGDTTGEGCDMDNHHQSAKHSNDGEIDGGSDSESGIDDVGRPETTLLPIQSNAPSDDDADASAANSHLDGQNQYSRNRCSLSATDYYHPPYLRPWDLPGADVSSCPHHEWGIPSCGHPFLSVGRAGDNDELCTARNESALIGGQTPLSASNGLQESATTAGVVDTSKGASAESESSQPQLPSTSETTTDVEHNRSAAGTVDAPVEMVDSAPVVSTGTVVDEQFVNAVDYASKSAGGLVINKSPNFHGTSNLLTSDRDRYAIVECQEPTKWVVIGLSEDILVKRVGISLFERYSSHVRDFSLLVSTTGTEAWRELGNFTAARAQGEQIFDMAVPMWARYVKFQILSHYGQEHYCTVSQIKVHGSTVLQGFHEQWQETDGAEGAAKVAAHASETLSAEAPLTDGKERSASSPRSDLEEGNTSAVTTQESTRLAPSSDVTSEISVTQSRSNSGEVLITQASLSEELYKDVFVWPESVSGEATCLRSASTLTASMQYADPEIALVPLVDPLGWKSTPLCLSRSVKAVNNAESLGSVDPTRRLVPTLRHNVSLSLPAMLDVPLIRLVQNVCSTLGWNVNFDFLSPIAQYVRYRGDSAEHLKDNNDSRVAPCTTSEDPIPSDLDRTHPESPIASAMESQSLDSVITSTVGRSGGIGLSHLFERYPSASCLSKVETTLVRVSQMKRGGGSGQGNVAGAQPGAGMEPVFKKLTDEIKALQASLAAHEELSKESVACFQEVLLEVFSDMVLQRQLQEKRFERLEQDYFGVGWIIALRSHLVRFLYLLLRLVDPALFSALGTGGWCLGCAGFTLAATTLTAFAVFRRGRISTRSACSVGSSCASAAPDCTGQVPAKPKVVTVSCTHHSTPDVSPLR